MNRGLDAVLVVQGLHLGPAVLEFTHIFLSLKVKHCGCAFFSDVEGIGFKKRVWTNHDVAVPDFIDGEVSQEVGVVPLNPSVHDVA